MRWLWCTAILAAVCGVASGLPTSNSVKSERVNDIDFDGPVASVESGESRSNMSIAITEEYNSHIDVENTIGEVQQILAKNPDLPRLTREDILTILENITGAAEHKASTDLPEVQTVTEMDTVFTELTTLTEVETTTPLIEKTRAEHDRSLLVVLPFNAKNLSETNMKELYTKPPLTQVIDSKSVQRWPHRRRPVLQEPPQEDQYKVTEEPDVQNPPPDMFYGSKRLKPSGKRPGNQDVGEVTQRPGGERTSSTRRRRPTPPPTTAATVGTTAQPTQIPVLSELPVRANAPRRRTNRPASISTTTVAPSSEEPISTPYKVDELSQIPSNHKPYYTEATVKPSPIYTTKKTPAKIKFDYGVDSLPSKKFVAPTIQWSPIPEDKKLSSVKENNREPVSNANKKVNASPDTPRPVIREDVKDLLASIGLSPNKNKFAPLRRPPTRSSTSTTTSTPASIIPDASNAAESLTPEMKDILMSIGLLPKPGEDKPLSLVPPAAPSAVVPTITTQPIVPPVDPSSYVQFKPLPISATSSRQDGNQMSQDMQEFLASFGLVPSIQSARIVSTPDEYFNMQDFPSYRRSKGVKSEEESTGESSTEVINNDNKSINSETDPDNTSYAELGNEESLPSAASLVDVPKINSDFLPSDMKGVLDNLGLSDKAGSKKTHTRDHIFNPVEHSAKLDDKREAEKIIKLLTSIRILDNITYAAAAAADGASFTTPRTTQKFGFRKKEKPSKSLHKLEESEAPNPLSIEELRLYLEAAKNEVKRQEPTTNVSSSAISSSSSSSASSSSESVAASAEATASGGGYDANAAEIGTTSGDMAETTEVNTDNIGLVFDILGDTSSTTSSSTTSTTTEAPVANLDDLAESFGGDGDRPKINSPMESLPPARPNGLYFLFDWNTFFNVGEEGKNPVRLNFSPRIGDPKRFINVQVP